MARAGIHNYVSTVTLDLVSKKIVHSNDSAPVFFKSLDFFHDFTQSDTLYRTVPVPLLDSREPTRTPRYANKRLLLLPAAPAKQKTQEDPVGPAARKGAQ